MPWCSGGGKRERGGRGERRAGDVSAGRGGGGGELEPESAKWAWSEWVFLAGVGVVIGVSEVLAIPTPALPGIAFRLFCHLRKVSD